MPLFSSSSPFDSDVEKATSELNTKEDIYLFQAICNRVKNTPNGPRDCLRSIVKRLNNKVPLVGLQSLSLLDACVESCGIAFHLELASHDFISECRTFITSGKPHVKVVQRLKQSIKKWATNEFKSSPALSLIPQLYESLKAEGQSFQFDDLPKENSAMASTSKEEEDLAKAIALSLKESGSKSGIGNSSSSGGSSKSIYPSMNSQSSYNNYYAASKPNKTVRTLYDFEAVEDNELTFKAGELIEVTDDSDPNWWRGSSLKGEGLFPANFVTADLTAEPEPEFGKSRKAVHFHEEIEVNVLDSNVSDVIEIDEPQIDQALDMIQNADPTGELGSDSNELLTLEERCKAMGPLIDQELEKVDKDHMAFMDLNMRLMDAFKMYNNLMTSSGVPTYAYPQQQIYQPSMQYPGMSTQNRLVQNIPHQNMPHPNILQQNMPPQNIPPQNMPVQNMHPQSIQTVTAQNMGGQNISQQNFQSQMSQNMPRGPSDISQNLAQFPQSCPMNIAEIPAAVSNQINFPPGTQSFGPPHQQNYGPTSDQNFGPIPNQNFRAPPNQHFQQQMAAQNMM